MYDVAVIGGGSAGSRAAFRLVAAGHRVIVMEKKEKLDEPVCCTGIVGVECVNSFGIPDNLIMRRVNSARLFSPAGKQLRLWRENTQACIVDHPALNVALAELAQSRGADYILGGAAAGLEVSSDGVRIKAIRNGQSREVRARAAVIAAGFTPQVLKLMNERGTSDFAVGVQAQVEVCDIDEIEVYFGNDIAPGFFAWLVPTRPKLGLAGLLSRRDASRRLRRFLAYLAARGKIISPDVKFSYDLVPLQPQRRTRDDRLIVIGDSAGQVKPTTGGGIYYGLICADIAAETLRRALESDNLSARSLSAYERAWKRKLGHELRVGYWARRLFERLDDRRIDRVFEIMSADGVVRSLLGSAELSFDWQSRGIIKGVGNAALSAALGIMRIPFRFPG